MVCYDCRVDCGFRPPDDDHPLSSQVGCIVQVIHVYDPAVEQVPILQGQTGGSRGPHAGSVWQWLAWTRPTLLRLCTLRGGGGGGRAVRLLGGGG